MTKTKVVLPKDVAKAVEYLQEIGITNYGIVGYLERGAKLGSSGLQPYLTVINKWISEEAVRPDILLTALVNGYEVEQTPEDRLRKYYEKVEVESFRANAKNQWRHEAELMGRLVGVRTTLRILGITIEGINDKGAK